MPSAPIIWFGNSAKLLKSSLVIPGATSGALTLTAAAATTSYSLTMPAAQGANGDVLTNDGSGGLSWAPAGGGSTPTSFTLVNDQATPANVTGFLLNSANEHGFVSEYTIERSYVGGTAVLDTAFYDNYRALGGISGGTLRLVKRQADGKVIIAGNFSNFNGASKGGVVRLNADGSPDTTFNTNVGTGVQSGSGIYGIDIQSDGKIVLVGNFNGFNGGSIQSIIRLNANGTEDTTFSTAISPGFEYSASPAQLRTVTVLPGDDLIIGGVFDTFAGAAAVSGLIKMDSAGALVSAFNTNMGTGFNNGPLVVTLQPDSKLIVGGYFSSFNGNTRNMLLRLNSAGTEDTGFYTNLGTGFAGGTGATHVTSATLQASGDILVGGDFGSLNGTTRDFILRLSSAGVDDGTFYTNLSGASSGPVKAISVYDDGAILVGGNFATFGGNAVDNIAKRNSDGTEDTVFTAAIGAGITGEVRGLDTSATDNVALLAGAFTLVDTTADLYVAKLEGDQDIVTQGTIRGLYKSAAWHLGGETNFGDTSGVIFSITSGGQLQYTSTDIPGAEVTSEMKFLITRI